MFLLAESLCLHLYKNADAGRYLRLYALLAPMLYCDAITDAMTKGLGQQKACVRYNILTSAMDVLFLYFLLPSYGMIGYFFSFLVTHVLNFGLSLHRLLKISHVKIPYYVPLLSASAAVISVWAAAHLQILPLRIPSYICLLTSLLYLLRIIGREDIQWISGMVTNKK